MADLYSILTRGQEPYEVAKQIQQREAQQSSLIKDYIAQHPQELQRRIDAIASRSNDPMDIESAFYQDPLISGSYDRSTIYELAQRTAKEHGWQGTAIDKSLNLDQSYEDNPENSWLGRSAVKAERAIERVIRGIGTGSFDDEANELHQRNRMLPLDQIHSIKDKQKALEGYDTQISILEQELLKSNTYEEANDIQQKIQALEEAKGNIEYTSQEQTLLRNGAVDEYDRNTSRIAELHREKEQFTGSTILSNISDSILPDHLRYAPEFEKARQQQFDYDFTLSGKEASYLTPEYFLAKAKDMAINGPNAEGWIASIAGVTPWLVLAPSLSGLGAGVLGTSLAIGRGLAFGSDLYSRYESMINEQYEKDPKSAPDMLRAVMGAVGSTAADFWGSKLVLDAPQKEILKRFFSTAYSEASRKAMTTAEKQLRGLHISHTSGVFANAYDKAFAEQMRSVSEEASKVLESFAKQSADLAGKRGASTKLASGITNTLSNVNSLAHKVGLGTQDFARAGIGLGIENMMSDTLRQYGGGTDLEDTDLESTIQSGLEGVLTGVGYHAPGLGLKATAMGAKSLANARSLSKYQATPSKYIDKAINNYSNDRKDSEHELELYAISNTESLNTLQNKIRDNFGKINEETQQQLHLDENTGIVTADANASPDVQELANKFNKANKALSDNIILANENLNKIKGARKQRKDKEWDKEYQNASMSDLNSDENTQSAFNELTESKQKDVIKQLYKDLNLEDSQVENIRKSLLSDETSTIEDKDFGPNATGVVEAMKDLGFNPSLLTGLSEKSVEALKKYHDAEDIKDRKEYKKELVDSIKTNDKPFEQFFNSNVFTQSDRAKGIKPLSDSVVDKMASLRNNEEGLNSFIENLTNDKNTEYKQQDDTTKKAVDEVVRGEDGTYNFDSEDEFIDSIRKSDTFKDNNKSLSQTEEDSLRTMYQNYFNSNKEGSLNNTIKEFNSLGSKKIATDKAKLDKYVKDLGLEQTHDIVEINSLGKTKGFYLKEKDLTKTLNEVNNKTNEIGSTLEKEDREVTTKEETDSYLKSLEDIAQNGKDENVTRLVDIIKEKYLSKDGTLNIDTLKRIKQVLHNLGDVYSSRKAETIAKAKKTTRDMNLEDFLHGYSNSGKIKRKTSYKAKEESVRRANEAKANVEASERAYKEKASVFFKNNSKLKDKDYTYIQNILMQFTLSNPDNYLNALKTSEEYKKTKDEGLKRQVQDSLKNIKLHKDTIGLIDTYISFMNIQLSNVNNNDIETVDSMNATLKALTDLKVLINEGYITLEENAPLLNYNNEDITEFPSYKERNDYYFGRISDIRGNLDLDNLEGITYDKDLVTTIFGTIMRGNLSPEMQIRLLSEETKQINGAINPNHNNIFNMFDSAYNGIWDFLTNTNNYIDGKPLLEYIISDLKDSPYSKIAKEWFNSVKDTTTSNIIAKFNDLKARNKKKANAVLLSLFDSPQVMAYWFGLAKFKSGTTKEGYRTNNIETITNYDDITVVLKNRFKLGVNNNNGLTLLQAISNIASIIQDPNTAGTNKDNYIGFQKFLIYKMLNCNLINGTVASNLLDSISYSATKGIDVKIWSDKDLDSYNKKNPSKTWTHRMIQDAYEGHLGFTFDESNIKDPTLPTEDDLRKLLTDKEVTEKDRQDKVIHNYGNIQYDFYVRNFKEKAKALFNKNQGKIDSNSNEYKAYMHARILMDKAYAFKGKSAIKYFNSISEGWTSYRRDSYTASNIVEFARKALSKDVVDNILGRDKDTKEAQSEQLEIISRISANPGQVIDFLKSLYDESGNFIGVTENTQIVGALPNILGNFFFGTKGSGNAIERYSIPTTYSSKTIKGTKVLMPSKESQTSWIRESTEISIQDKFKTKDWRDLGSTHADSNIMNSSPEGLFSLNAIMGPFAELFNKMVTKGQMVLECNPSESRPLDAILSAGEGNFYATRALQAIAGSSLVLAQTLMGATQDKDFLDKLGDTRLATEYIKEGYLDLDKVVENFGKTAIRAFGYRGDINDEFIRRDIMQLGAMAVTMLDASGIATMYHVKMVDGKVSKTRFDSYSDNNKALANSRRVLKVNTDVLRGVSDTLNSTHAIQNGKTIKPIEKFFNCDFINNSCADTKKDFEQEQARWRDEFRAEYNNSKNEGNFFNLYATSTQDDVNIIWDGTNQKVVLIFNKPGALQGLTIPGYRENATGQMLVLPKEFLEKDDGTIVTKERLIEKALETISPNLCRVKHFRAIYGFLKDAEDSLAEDIYIDDPKDLRKQALRDLIGYPKNGLQLTGIKLDNARANFVTQAKKAISDYKEFERLVSQMAQDNNGKEPEVLELYYNEITVKNNRAYTDSLLFNYRENKLLRNFFTKSNKPMRLKQGKNPIGFKASILHNLGFKVDKVTFENFNKAWDTLSNIKEFQDLFNHIDETNPLEIRKVILERIDKLNKALKNFEYEVAGKNITDAQDATNATESTRLKISANAESLAMIYNIANEITITITKPSSTDNLLQMNDSRGKQLMGYLNGGEQSLNLVDVNNWTAQLEIDGLTNGVLIRFIQSQGTMDGTSFAQAVAGGVIDKNSKELADDVSYFIASRNTDGGRFFDTYEMTSIAIRNEMSANYLKRIMGSNGQTSVDDALRLIKTIVSDEDGTFTNNIIKDLSDEVLTRNFSKPPTMTVSYGVGKESLFARLYDILEGNDPDKTYDRGISNAFYQASLGNRDKILNIVTQLASLNGGTATITHSKGGTLVVDTQGKILKNNGVNLIGTEYLGQLDKAIFADLDIFLNDESTYSTLKSNLSKAFMEPVWNGVMNIQKESKDHDALIGEASDLLANAYNTLLSIKAEALMEKYKDPKNTDREAFLDAINQSAKEIENALDPQIEISIGKDALAMFKNQKKLTSEVFAGMLSELLKTKNNEYLFKYKTSAVLKEALGSGVGPLTTHTIDSSNIHRMMYNVRRQLGSLLTIHDAIIVKPDALESAPELNKQFWINTINRWRTFQSRDNLVARMVNLLNETYRAEGTPASALVEIEKLRNSANDLYLRCREETDIQKQKTIENLEKQKNGGFYIDQYSTFGMNLSAWQPTNADIEEQINAIVNSSAFTSDTQINSLLVRLKDKFRSENNQQIKDLFKDCFFNTDNKQSATVEFKEGLFKEANSIDSLEKVMLNILDNAKKNQPSTSAITTLAKNRVKKYINESALDIRKEISSLIPSLVNKRFSINENRDPETTNKIIHRGLDNKSPRKAQVTSLLKLIGTQSDSGLETVSKISSIYEKAGRVINQIGGLFTYMGNSFNQTILGALLVNMVKEHVDSSQTYEFVKMFSGLIRDNLFDNVQTTIPSTGRKKVHWEVGGELDYIALHNWLKLRRRKNVVDARFEVNNVSAWYEKNILNEIAKKYEGMEADETVVLTMQTHRDVLVLNALNQLKKSGRFNGNIVVMPAMSDLNVPGVNRNALVDNRLSNLLGNDKKNLIREISKAPNKYTDLNYLGYVVGNDITESYIEKGTTTRSKIAIDPKSLGGEDYTNIETKDPSYIDPITPGYASLRLTKTNEYGEAYSSNLYNVDGGESWNRTALNYLDLETTPFNNKQLDFIDSDKTISINGNTKRILDATTAEKKEFCSLDGDNWGGLLKEDRDERVLDLNDGSKFEDMLQPGNIIQINMLSSGDFLNAKYASVINNNPILKNAYIKYKAEIARRKKALYSKEISLDQYKTPIRVTTDDDLQFGGSITCMFMVAVDNMVSTEDIRKGLNFHTANQSMTVKTLQSINADTKLYNIVNHSKLVSIQKWAMSSLGKFRSDYAEEGYVEVPPYLLQERVLNTLPNNYEDSSTSPGLTNQTFLHTLEDIDFSKYYILTTDALQFSEDVPDRYSQNTYTHKGMKFASLAKTTKKSIAQVNNTMLGNMYKKSANVVNNILGKPTVRGYDTDSIDIIQRVKTEQTSREAMREQIEGAIVQDKSNNATSSHREQLSKWLIESNINLFTAYLPELGRTGASLSKPVIKLENGFKHYEHHAVYGRTAEQGQSNLEIILHEGLVHPVMELMDLDPTASRQASQLYDLVMRHITIDHFTSCSTAEAERILNYIQGKSGKEAVMEFFAYATTNEDLRTAIDNIKVNKETKNNLFARISSIFSRIYHAIFDRAIKDGKPQNDMVATVDKLFERFYRVANAEWGNVPVKKSISELTDTLLNKADKSFRKIALGILSENVDILENIKAIQKEGNFPFEDDVLALVNQGIEHLLKSKSKLSNPLWDLFDKAYNSKISTEFKNSILGNSKEQWDYLQHNLMAKQVIDASREQASNTMTNEVNKILGDLSPKIKNNLTHYLLRTDASVLYANLDTTTAREYIKSPEARKRAIADLESSLRSYTDGNYYVNATKGLADYLTKGINTSGLGYRTAYEIATKAGSGSWSGVNTDGSLIRNIDMLASLYAIDEMNTKDKSIYANIPDEILDRLAKLHNSIKQAEIKYVFGEDSEASKHIPKGMISGGNTMASYSIMSADNMKAIKWSTPTSIKQTKLDPFYKSFGKDFVNVFYRFRSPIPVEAGIFAMTDKYQGRTQSGIQVDKANRVDEADDNGLVRGDSLRKVARYLDKRIEALNNPNAKFIDPSSVDGTMVPSFGLNGQLAGANFELNQLEADRMMNTNYFFSNVMGDLYGSIYERGTSEEVNIEVAKATDEIYKSAKNKDDFVWINSESTDLDIQEFYRRVPREVREYFDRLYPNRGVPIKKSCLNLALGKRATSSKVLDEEYYAKVKEGSIQFMDIAKHMFRHGSVNQFEELIQFLTKIGKENLVIKGASVSINNYISNCMMLTNIGIPPEDMIKFQLEGAEQVQQLNEYVDRLEELNLKSDTDGLTDAEMKEYKILRDKMQTLPIWELYSSGSLGTIVEDTTSSNHIIKNFIDKHFKSSTAKPIHNIANDQASNFYKMLRNFATMGDKAGKYALYKYLTQTKSYSKKEALRECNKYFINYNIPLPTGIDYIDSLGIFPFAKYTFGIQTVLADSLVKKPVRSLLHILGLNTIAKGTASMYQSLLGIDKGFNFPGFEIFLDSFKSILSYRAVSAVV